MPLFATPFLIVAWISRQSLSDGPQRFLIVLRSLNDDTLFTFNCTIFQFHRIEITSEKFAFLQSFQTRKSMNEKHIRRKGNYVFVSELFLVTQLIAAFHGTSGWSWYPFNDISTTATTISNSECTSPQLPLPHRRSTTGIFPLLYLFHLRSSRSQHALDAHVMWMNRCCCCRRRRRIGIKLWKTAHLASKSNWAQTLSPHLHAVIADAEH